MALRAEDRFDHLISQAIARWAPVYGVRIPAALVKGVIATESAFNPNAVGGAGEIGLMQVMPATARELGVRDPQTLFDPAIAISTGVKYLAALLSRFGGRLQLAVAGYNAGPGNVDAQRGTYPNPSYVLKVLQAANRFTRGATAAPGPWWMLGAAAAALLILPRLLGRNRQRGRA